MLHPSKVRILKAAGNSMSAQNLTKHFHPVELSNDERLAASELMTSLKEAGHLPGSTNLGQFISYCFFLGLNECRKDLYRQD